MWVRTAGLLLAGLFLFGCTDSGSSSTSESHGLAADQVIKFASFSFGCTYESQFAQAHEHYVRKELSAWAGMVSSQRDCISSGLLEADPSINWVVLQIRGKMMQVGIASLRDYERMKNLKSEFGSDQKYWTLVSYGVKISDSITEYRENISNPIVPAAPLASQPVTSRNGRYVILVTALDRDVRRSELEKKLKESNIKSFSRQVVIDGVRTMRIQTGPYSTNKKAAEALSQLNRVGLGGTLYSDGAQ